MKNIFLIYIPPGNHEAVVHYEETIKSKVLPERIYPFIGQNLRRRLTSIFNNRPIAVWGSRDTSANRAKFEQMSAGDEILIIEGDTIKLLGKIALTTINPDLSRELWKNLRDETTEGWKLIYFIANPVEIGLPFAEFCELFGYQMNYQLRGFTSVGPGKLEEFYSKYDDLYSILILRKQGQPPQRKAQGQDILPSGEEVLVSPEDVSSILDNKTFSDHLRMQWTLIGLGEKCGSKVWIPASDQKRIRENYQYEDFETNFAAGLDTQTRYVENIDVVWKEEFRIDAAFEIENSTAIYSGLLRFADLSLVAPNTTYPLFIVAPQEKRNRLIEQLKRPVFKQMRLPEKVRYLSYERVDEIDNFARDMDHGLNIDLIVAKSEQISGAV